MVQLEQRNCHLIESNTTNSRKNKSKGIWKDRHQPWHDQDPNVHKCETKFGLQKVLHFYFASMQKPQRQTKGKFKDILKTYLFHIWILYQLEWHVPNWNHQWHFSARCTLIGHFHWNILPEPVACWYVSNPVPDQLLMLIILVKENKFLNTLKW